MPRVTIPVARALIWEYANAVKIDPVSGLRGALPAQHPRRHLRETMSTIWSSMFGVHGDVTQLNPFAYVRHKRHFVEKTYAASVEEPPASSASPMKWSSRTRARRRWSHTRLRCASSSILTRFLCEHYKPDDHPNEMLISHWKTGLSRWVSLHDDDGSPLYPALEKRLDLLKGDRKSGILDPEGWHPRQALGPAGPPVEQVLWRFSADRGQGGICRSN